MTESEQVSLLIAAQQETPNAWSLDPENKGALKALILNYTRLLLEKQEAREFEAYCAGYERRRRHITRDVLNMEREFEAWKNKAV